MDKGNVGHPAIGMVVLEGIGGPGVDELPQGAVESCKLRIAHHRDVHHRFGFVEHPKTLGSDLETLFEPGELGNDGLEFPEIVVLRHVVGEVDNGFIVKMRYTEPALKLPPQVFDNGTVPGIEQGDDPVHAWGANFVSHIYLAYPGFRNCQYFRQRQATQKTPKSHPKASLK